MFTGIIETMGTVKQKKGGTLEISPKKPLNGLQGGESISVDGVCLTLDSFHGATVSFRLLPETIRVSTLGSLGAGDKVNLERSLKVGDRLGGHLLLGHVDGQGTLISRLEKGETLTLEIDVPPHLTPSLVPKGPIALDGVSLTLDPELKKNRIRVHLISHTARATTLSRKSIGNRVNIELDLIAKYLRGMLY